MNKETIYTISREDYRPNIVKVVDNFTLPAVDISKLGLMQAGLAQRPVGQKLEHAIAFILVANAINYQFWNLSEDGKLIRYEYDGKVGAMGMRAAIDAAWGDDATPDTFRQKLLSVGVTGIFGDIPNVTMRSVHLSELLFGPSLEAFCQWLARKTQDTLKLSTADAEALAATFPRTYQDRYMKRAQLALAEIAGHLSEIGQPVELEVTAFADYQVPRVLRALGVLEYSTELAAKVDSLTVIDPGSEEELAIRAATILGCKALAEKLDISEAAIDNYLWLNRNSVGSTPFHLTYSTDY